MAASDESKNEVCEVKFDDRAPEVRMSNVSTKAAVVVANHIVNMVRSNTPEGTFHYTIVCFS